MESATSSGQSELTPAQRMMQQHQAAEAHQPTIEEVVDQDDIEHPAPSTLAAQDTDSPQAPLANGQAMSAKALGKQKAQDSPLRDVTNKPRPTAPTLDTQSEEAFPSLGAGKAKAPTSAAWGNKPASVARSNGIQALARPNGTLDSSASSGYSTPAAAYGPRGTTAPISLPGRYTENMTMRTDQLRADLRRPLAALLQDINKKSKAKVEISRAAGFVTFRGQGPNVESVHELLRDVAAQVGTKQTLKVPVPSSLRAHIIGKAGSTIDGIKKRTGANIQIPRSTDIPDDDDDMIDVEIEGNPIAVVLARNEVESIVNQRTSTVNLKMKDVPAEYFPFIAGAHNIRANAFEQDRNVRVKVPHYHTWQSQAPSASTISALKPQDGLHIQISGEREAARQIQAEIERQVLEFQQALTLTQISIEQARHQFIAGDKGGSLHDFLEETGCTIILPPSTEDTETITIIGPPDRMENAMNKAMDLASSMYMQSVDVARQHPNAPMGAQAHSQDLARYLRQRQAIEQFEKQYDAQVVLPTTTESTGPWQIFSRDPKSAMRARTNFMNLVSGHPPARFRNVNVHPFYQRELERQHASALREQHGVHVVSSDDSQSPQVLLVYEGPSAASEYDFPRGQPSADESKEFGQALEEAEALLLDLIGAQEEIVARSVAAPIKYREKLHKHLARAEQREPHARYPVQLLPQPDQVSASGQNYPVEFRGPSNAVDEYEQMLKAFIEEQIRDEAERDYTISFDFPQKFASFLIGKGGENINKLREEFDVEIQVPDGKVEIKGPKPKADAAKAHILSLGRKLEDETTHILRISPKFHRELIGAKGSQVLRLQERYNVRINFPRSKSDEPSGDDTASDAGAAPRRRGPPQGADEVIVKGPRKGADEAKDELWSLYTYMQEISHTATISIAQSQIPSIIGQGGRELQSLRETTRAEIDIPSKDDVDASGRVEVKLKGTKLAVEQAKKLLQDKVKVFDESVTRSVEVDRQHHRALIGQGGENIRRIIVDAGGSGDSPRDLARMVQFPRVNSPESEIQVEGKEDVVNRIIETIQSFVKARESQVTETIEVAPERHGALIGRGGETRKSIESNHNVNLVIPSTNVTGNARSMIKITGTPEDVEKAKQRILGMVKEKPGEIIQVPVRLHHAVADMNGNIFQSLKRDFRVTVDHGGRDRPTRQEAPRPNFSNGSSANLPLITDADSAPPSIEENHLWDIVAAVPEASGDDSSIPWILRGADVEAVAKARAKIEKALAAAENSVTGYLVLPDPKTYRFVIGPGGSTVKDIRSETSCKIDVPKAGGDKDAIEIVGVREQVEKAKARILEAVMSAAANGPTRR